MPSSPMVTVIVDRNCGDRLPELASTGPVWIIESPANRLAVDRHWKESPARSHLDGVTIFDGFGVVAPDEIFLNVLDMVDLHHGEYSSDPPYGEIRAIGTTTTDDIERELLSFGFSVCVSDSNSFQANRNSTDPVQ